MKKASFLVISALFSVAVPALAESYISDSWDTASDHQVIDNVKVESNKISSSEKKSKEYMDPQISTGHEQN